MQSEDMKTQVLVESLLGELRYVLDTGDIRDSERNSREVRDRAAQWLGFQDYKGWKAAID